VGSTLLTRPRAADNSLGRSNSMPPYDSVVDPNAVELRERREGHGSAGVLRCLG